MNESIIPDADLQASSLTFSQSELRRLSAEERQRILVNPIFGRHFTDHMVTADWSAAQGWENGRVHAFANLSLSPASSVFHYAPEIFEGMKAYRHPDGSAHVFRPYDHARRFRASAQRMALPQMQEEDFVLSIEALVRADADWVPSGQGQSLYIRPFMFANEAYFGAETTFSAEYHVIATPVGNYIRSEGGIRMWVEQRYARASEYGTGSAKTGGNYAAAALPTQAARERGYDHVLFLDAETHSKVDEAGSMNIFFITSQGDLWTPALSGAILDGITRRSIIQLAKDAGIEVLERIIELSEMRNDADRGLIVGAFATGTAAQVAPISQLDGEGFDIHFAQLEPITRFIETLRSGLIGIQRGTEIDRHGWMHHIPGT